MNKFRCSSLSLVFAFLMACEPSAAAPPSSSNGPGFIINPPLETYTELKTVWVNLL